MSKALLDVQQLGELLKNKMSPGFTAEEIEGLIKRVPKPVGSFGYDPWGYNEHRARQALMIGGWLYRHYFRTQASGLENVPAEGRVMLVANHSGQLPLDGLLIGVALASNPLAPRACRPMIERFFPTVPWIAPMLTSWGAVIGDPLNCSRMLEREEAVLVFPEGVRGSGKLWRDRYKLQRFGSGFMHLAAQHDAPIVPVGVVGCEETMPSFGNLKPVAKLLGIPYFPLCPSYVPLPSRVFLNFGKPIHFSDKAKSENEVRARIEEVKLQINELIAEGLQQRQEAAE